MTASEHERGVERNPIKQMAVLTIIQYEDGSPQAIITSHPDGNEIEALFKSVIELINTALAHPKSPTPGATHQ